MVYVGYDLNILRYVGYEMTFFPTRTDISKAQNQYEEFELGDDCFSSFWFQFLAYRFWFMILDFGFSF